jgi:hypothetical protein
MTAHKDKQGLTHTTRDYKPIETRKSSLLVSLCMLMKYAKQVKQVIYPILMRLKLRRSDHRFFKIIFPFEEIRHIGHSCARVYIYIYRERERERERKARQSHLLSGNSNNQ